MNVQRGLVIAIAIAAGCVGYEPGVEVALLVRPSSDGALTDVSLGDGSAMRLDGLTLEIESAELIPCGATGGHHHTALEDVVRELVSLPRAFAQHHHGSPLVLMGPFTIDFAAASVELPGVLGAAPGCYDRVALVLRDLALSAHHEGASLSARSTTTVTASARIEPPLHIEGREARTIAVDLARSSPFALLTTRGEVDGDRVLAGIAAQSRATPLD